MQDFFKSARFKILAALVVVMFFFMLRAAQDGTAMPMLSRVTGVLLTPMQRVSAHLSNAVSDALTPFFDAPQISEDNAALREENAALRNMLVEYERYKSENEQLRDYLEIKKKNPDFDFEPGLVIGRDAADRFYSFTIDKGERDG
ncbi:MAG: rod shape-determining protein MreC, partial [Oscillospiraceae bacterium]